MDFLRAVDFPTMWQVAGVLVTSLAGVGFAVVAMTPASFRAARVCFALAAVILAGAAVAHAFSDYAHRAMLASIILIADAIGLLACLKWVSLRETAALHTQREPLPHPPIHVTVAAPQPSFVERISARAVKTQNPRLVLGLDPTRTEMVPILGEQQEPVFLTNDGQDTALSIRVQDVDYYGRRLQFIPSSDHLIADPKMTLTVGVYSEREHPWLPRLIANALESRIKAGEACPIEDRIPVRISFRNHSQREFHVRYDIVSRAVRTERGYEIEASRVDLSREK